MHEVLNNLILFIENHKNIAYIILFLWAMWESLFPLSLFMYWEIFFLAWAILAWYWVLNIYIVAPLLIMWWFIGDNTSYFLWYKYWDKIINYLKQHKYFWKYLNNDNFNKLDKFFKEKWWLWVLIARFSWPLAWVTPFIAWSFGLKYKEFLKYDIVWVLGWIWLFIFVWYVFWKNFDWILNVLWNSILVIIWILIFLLIIYKFIKKYLNNKKND